MTEATHGEPVIEIRGVETRLGGHPVHRGLDLEVRCGEVLCLVGGSGSGKSTLLREIIGLSQPDAGHIRVFGEDVHRTDPSGAHELRTRWGVLFQEGALFSALDVFDNVAFPLRELRTTGDTVDEDEVYELVMLKLQMVGIDSEDAWKLPAELSGGMVKRVALARALALEPELLFLDEPTAGLDPEAAAAFDDMLVRFHRDLALSALVITHDLQSLATVSSRVAVIAEGCVVAVGTLDEVVASDHPFVRRFFHGRRGEALIRSLR
jgi:phospholipid/cholesterol/gamma-HCH transport system ATP-binding protein